MRILRPEIGTEEVARRAKRVRLLLMDCDGVMTDGRLYFGPTGEIMKVFDVKDGQGIASWHAHGFPSGIITGRRADEIVRARAHELSIRFVRTGSADKLVDLRSILSESGIGEDETAFIGDDLGDLPILKTVGFPVAVSDAVEPVKRICMIVTDSCGGRGAIRELIDFILDAKRKP